MVKLLKERGENKKYIEKKVLQGYYAQGWEDIEEVDADDFEQVKELRDDLKAYRENQPEYVYRIITRKVDNPDYDASKARKRNAGGFAVIINPSSRDEEVWFTDDPSIDYETMSDSKYTLGSKLAGFRTILTGAGYDFITYNFQKIDKGNYSFKKYYSYYALYINGGYRVATTMYVEYN